MNGTMTIEDVTVTWVTDPSTNSTHVQVRDLFTGEYEEYDAESKSVHAALSLLIHWDGEGSPETHTLAELGIRNIRWVP